MSVVKTVEEVTARIAARSAGTRREYLTRIDQARQKGVNRAILSCGNLAHGFAACAPADKAKLAGSKSLNLGIVTSYNDMLSAHQPYGTYPEIIKEAARSIGATAQVAGGVPAMCDGVTQGQPGMDLSLFSRDVIAMATAIALSHNMFDAAVYLGICDKIVPGLMIGALTFGHLPAVFVPAGPMPSGIPNDEKAKVRQLYAEGKVGRAELLESEAKSYHSPGTCTFYGTANSNQMLMEIMGLHLPGASFVNPGTPLRDALTKEAAKRALSLTAEGNDYTPIGHVIDEKAIVNGMVGPAGDRWFHQPHPAPRRHRRRGGPEGHLGGHVRALGRRAAARPRLSQRHGRREPLPRRRRHGLPDPRTARGRVPARGRQDRLGQGPFGLHRRSEAQRGEAQLRARPRALRQPQGARPAEGAVLAERRPQAA